MIDNLKSKAVKKLAFKELVKKKNRTIMVVLAIVLTSFTISSIFGIGVSYIDSLQHQKLSLDGIKYDALLTSPTKNQIDILENTQEVGILGIQFTCAMAIQSGDDHNTNFMLRWKDENNWNKLTIPAMEHIEGNYPKKTNEIMMSEWALKESGVNDFEIGMEIPIKYVDSNGVKEQTFVLVGYYRDNSYLMDPTNSGALVSEEFLRTTGYYVYGEENSKLYLTFNDREISSKQQEKIKKELNLNNQVFLLNQESEDNGAILVGVVLLSLLILVISYLLIYNVLFISVTNDIRYYGLLKSIGMSNRQIKKMIQFQMLIMGSVGIVLGLIISLLISNILITRVLHLLSTEFITNTLVSFNPIIYLSSAILTIMALYIVNRKISKILVSLSVIDASKLHINNKSSLKEKKSKNVILQLATNSFIGDKKKTIIVIISLFIGITSYICANSIIEARNAEDYIDYYSTSDISLGNQSMYGEKSEQVFDKILLDEIDEIDGVSTIRKTSSNEGVLKFDEKLQEKYLKEYFSKYMNISYEEGVKEIRQNPEFLYAYVVGIGSEDFKDINSSLSRKISEKDFESGKTGILCNSSGVDEISTLLNQKLTFSIDDKEFSIMAVDSTEVVLTNFTGIAPTIYISEKAFHNLKINPLYERIKIDFKDKFDKITNDRIERLVEEDSRISVISRTTMLREMKESNLQLFIFGNSMIIILLVIGILNFINVLANNIISKKKELAILSSIGASEKQINKILIFEGLCYGIISLLLSFTVGLGISYLIFELVKDEPYMKFEVSFFTIIIIVFLIIVISIIAPLLIRKLQKNKSTVEELKKIG